VRRHGKASTAESTQCQATGLGRILRGAFAGRASALLLALASCAVFASLVATSATAATCPNTVFRTGPSAKLPDCRAYELISPKFTGGLPPSAADFIFEENSAPSLMVTPSGNDVVFNTQSGALGNSPGTGVADRYRSRRTESGWVVDFYGATGTQTPNPNYGGLSEDHGYYFMTAGINDFGLEPYAELQSRFGGLYAVYVHTPSGFHLLSEGTEGAYPNVTAEVKGFHIAPHGDHVIFDSEAKLEPQAPPTGTNAVYDWTPTGNKVVSLLPGNVPLADGEDARFVGSSKDGTEVAFEVGGSMYVRVDNTATKEVARPNGVVVGQELDCEAAVEGEAGGFTYQWLRNGIPTVGATGSTYTVTSADQGTQLQCQASATGGEGGSIAISPAWLVAPYPGNPPTSLTGFNTVESGGSPVLQATPGEQLTCNARVWTGGPTFAYQWFRNGATIAGATASTYTPEAGDNKTAIQCRVIATNAGGGAAVMSRNVLVFTPTDEPTIPQLVIGPPQKQGLTSMGVFGGHVFYADKLMHYFAGDFIEAPANLFEYDVAEETSTPIALTNDASVVSISEDGSHVYFVSPSEVGGEGADGEPNLYVWSAADHSTKFITVLAEADVNGNGIDGVPGLTTWYTGFFDERGLETGIGRDHSRVTPDGSVLVFESLGQLTSFNNNGQVEIYRYDADSEQLSCVSCPPTGGGPATAAASLETLSVGPFQPQLLSANTLTTNVTDDGKTVVFQSEEGLVPQDGNDQRDIYEWKAGQGVSLISTGQDLHRSMLYGMTPDASDIVFETQEKLLPEDENGAAQRLYDARVNGGFPPPESSVTEKCSGDICQGAPSAAPDAPQVTSSSLSGTGNVPAKRRCGKHRRSASRNGKEVCLSRKHRKHRHRGRAGAHRRATR
jgi:hypothetical protein